MPRGDGTGPAGNGPMTGRAAGYCAGNNQPGYMNIRRVTPVKRNKVNRFSGRGCGRGAGRGARGGRGRGRR